MWALLEVTKNGKIGPEDVGIVWLGSVESKQPDSLVIRFAGKNLATQFYALHDLTTFPQCIQRTDFCASLSHELTKNLLDIY